MEEDIQYLEYHITAFRIMQELSKLKGSIYDCGFHHLFAREIDIPTIVLNDINGSVVHMTYDLTLCVHRKEA